MERQRPSAGNYRGTRREDPTVGWKPLDGCNMRVIQKSHPRHSVFSERARAHSISFVERIKVDLRTWVLDGVRFSVMKAFITGFYYNF